MAQANYLLDVVRELTPIEVFDFYDGPRFYSCRDLVGQLYLVYWVDETPEAASWLYLRISLDRYASLKHGEIAIAKALSDPEEGRAFVVSVSGDQIAAEEIKASQIDPEWLPDPDDRLSLANPSLPEKLVSAVDVARSTNRQVFDIAFDKLSNTYEIGCGKLGRLLDSIQNTIYALSCDPHADVRRVPEEIKYKSEVLVTGLFASSFGVRLQSKGSDFFSSDETARAIQTLNELLASLVVPETISEELHRRNILARSRFKHLLGVMIESGVSIKTDWGSPIGGSMQARATYDEIKLAYQKLAATDKSTSRVVERQANMVGVDVRNDFFALIVEENEIIKGKLAKSLLNRQFEVPSQILAKLEETCVIDPLTDREKWTYVLLDVQNV